VIIELLEERVVVELGRDLELLGVEGDALR
jgi:hypothetical protein